MSPDPTIHRRRLRSELRKAREAAGRTQREVAAAMEWSVSKLIRIETGDVRITVTDLRALLSFYKSSSDQLEALLAMARAAREPARWAAYRNVASPEFISFCGFEWHASVIRNFEPIVIPGLLQTEQYAEAVLKSLSPAKGDFEPLVDLRMQRQEILTREANPPRFHFIIDESVLWRIVGSTRIMRAQLQHLLDILDRQNLSIRIVPLKLGVYPHMTTGYVLFEFPDPEDEDVLWLENALGGMVIRENSSQERGDGTPVNYLSYFWELEQRARTEDTQEHLDRALRALS